jgi:hypothetical protein
MTTATPSQGRRQALRDADKSNVLLVIDTYPIDKYYAVMDRLVKEFYAAVDARQLDQAYIYGVRYASFSLESLPKHREYKRTFTRKKAAQVEQVLAKLESVTERMDAEELQKQHREAQARRAAEQAKQQEEQLDREQKGAKHQQMMDKLRRGQNEAKLQQQQQQQQSSRKAKNTSTKQSALAKLQALQQQSDMHLKANEQKKPATAAPVRPAPAKLDKKESRQEEERKRVEQHQRQKDDLTLQKERQRLADQAERLTQHQREEKAKQEEWETTKFLFHEAVVGERQDAEAAEAAAASAKEEERRRLVKKSQQAQATQQKKEAERRLARAAAAKKEEEEKMKQKRAKATKSNKAPALAETKQPKVEQVQATPEVAKEIPTTPLPQMQPTIASLPIEQKIVAAVSSPYQPKGMRPEEKRTIRILEDTIVKQEQRLQDLEEKNIPALLAIAKMKLTSGNRKEALFCMARKKKLDATVEGLKNAIFTMETQILMLESAVENRQVEKAMRAAADAMESLQGGVSVSGIHDVNQVVTEFSESVVDEIDFDEDELLRELEASTTTVANADAPEHASILSLPSVPIEELPEVEAAPTKKPSGLLTGWL